MPLSSYFSGKPVILALVYYQCPMLCTQILNGLVISLRGMSLESGRDFEVMAVSIDPTETPDLAARKKAEYLRRYAKSSAGWHFLTGAEPQIRQLADAVGFRYAYDPQTKQYAHASAIMVRRPAAEFPDISTESNTRHGICAWAWWRRPKTRLAQRPIRSCSTATTTTQHRKILRDRHQHRALGRSFDARDLRLSLNLAVAARFAAQPAAQPGMMRVPYR